MFSPFSSVQIIHFSSGKKSTFLTTLFLCGFKIIKQSIKKKQAFFFKDKQAQGICKRAERGSRTLHLLTGGDFQRLTSLSASSTTQEIKNPLIILMLVIVNQFDAWSIPVFTSFTHLELKLVHSENKFSHCPPRF